MKIEIKEMSRTSENDIIEIEGKIIRALTPKEGEWGWSQFVVVKDNTDKMGAWLKLDGEDDKVLKGSSVKVKGKVSKKFKNSQGKMARSLNGCQFEVIGRVQAPAQSSAQSTGNGNGTKDNYWEKKFKYEVEKDPIVQIVIIRQCAIKAVTELAKVTPSKNFLIKVHTEKDFFEFAIKIEKHIFRNLVLKESILTFGGKITGVSKDGTPKVETKEEKIKKARETVGETEFKPASEKQKNVIFGYRDKDGWHKGIIESRYIEKHEIKKIGDPKKLSVEKASEWIEFWWGDQFDPDDIGARKQREIEHPRNEDGPLVGALVKGDKTSLVKDVLVDEINVLRRENFLSDDVKFREELGYNPDFEELTEKELKTLKDLLTNYHPKDWDEK